ncbi:hypothetical protein AVEN_165683-1 [Araneus ventricosus]|uniref:Uncharacterized protein n=1 Tax=Araneus ventricosus TaxID=182803 RepID=A0A4Y2C5C7_ARAVE|nr:hypothetical protein AVEN_165683-1 [Araneus ventricosus]
MPSRTVEKCKQVVDSNMTSSDKRLIRFSFGTFQCAGWHRVYVNRPERVNIKTNTSDDSFTPERDLSEDLDPQKRTTGSDSNQKERIRRILGIGFVMNPRNRIRDDSAESDS